MICQACMEPKRTLKPERSELLPDLIINRCTACMNADNQPRWVLIMAAKRHGVSYVSKYIDNHMYAGKDITLREIT